MRFKFSTLVPSVIVLFACVAGAFAQGQTLVPKVGYLRFWNMLPPSRGQFDLVKIGATPEQSALLSRAASYRYSSYTELPVGRYQFAVFKTGDRRTSLRTFAVDVQPDTFFTVSVSPRGVEFMNDTNNPKATTGTLIIRNFFPGLVVSVESPTRNIVTALAYGQSVSAAGQPLARLPITLRAPLPNGTAVQSSVEADLRASKRATVLIIPDSYGRFRPRVMVDGKNL
jgi:hypothetical protein